MSVCTIDGCGRPVKGHGMCSMHYRRWQRHADPRAVAMVRASERVTLSTSCTVDGCSRQPHSRGYCATHYSRWLRHGDPGHLTAPPAPKECSIDGCSRRARARGWCPLHWDRYRRNGDPLLVQVTRATKDMSTWDRFWVRVDVGLCWEWTGANDGGYGMFSAGGHNVKAYRWAYEALVGQIPAGLHIDHLCRNPACVNPDHLEPVTQAENTRRARAARFW